MTETADTYFGFGNKHHLGDWQRRHSLFFLLVVTPQTLGRHAQTRADLADTRRHARSHAHRPRKRQARVRHVHSGKRRRPHTWLQARGRQAHHERHFGSTLGFRQERRHAHTRRERRPEAHHERHLVSTHLAEQTGERPRETLRVHTWMTKIGVSEKEENDHNPNSCGCAKCNLSGDSTFCIFSLYTDSRKSESVRGREVIQKAIFPVTPLFAYFLIHRFTKIGVSAKEGSDPKPTHVDAQKQSFR